MVRSTSIEKKEVILRRFWQLLRSGKDYTTRFMYSEAGAKAFVAGKTAAAVVRNHYKGSVISKRMSIFVRQNSGVAHEQLVAKFGREFGLCERESRYLIRFIKHNKNR